jgi:hypothetical protein
MKKAGALRRRPFFYPELIREERYPDKGSSALLIGASALVGLIILALAAFLTTLLAALLTLPVSVAALLLLLAGVLPLRIVLLLLRITVSVVAHVISLRMICEPGRRTYA